MKQLFANNAKTTLAQSVATTDTSITVATGDGAKFPNPTPNVSFFNVTVEANGAFEIMQCTSRNGDVLNVTRGTGGTSATTWNVGSNVEMKLDANTIAGFSRLVDRLTPISSIENLVAPTNSDANSYISGSFDDGDNVIVAVRYNDFKWKFITHSKTVASGSITGTSTTTQAVSSAIGNSVGFPSTGKYIIHFISGQNAGLARLINATSANQVSWNTALPSIPQNGDNFEIYESTIGQINDILSEISGIQHNFLVQPTPTYSMQVQVTGGTIFDGTNVTLVSAQTPPAIVAPSSNPRIDLVVIDELTGSAEIVQGVEATSPVQPAVPTGKIPLAIINLKTTTTYIDNTIIKQETSGLPGYIPFKGDTIQVDPTAGLFKVLSGKRALFNGATDDGSTALQVSGGGNFTGTILGSKSGASKNGNFNAQSAGTASYAITVTDAATDSKNWDLIANGTTLYGRVLSDDIATTVNNWLTVTRSGATITNLALPERVLVNGATDDGSTALQVAGNGSFTGTLNANSAGTNIRIKGDGTTGNDAGIWATAAGDIYLANWINNRGWHIAPNGNIASIGSGRLLLGGATDDGSTALQVAGGGKFTDTLRITSGSYTTPAAGSVFAYGHASAGAVIGGSGSASDLSLMNKNGTVVASIPTGSARFLLGPATDDGSTALQVTGAAKATGDIFNDDGANGRLVLRNSASYNSLLSMTTGAGAYKNLQLYAQRFLLNTSIDNGTDALQVNGSTLQTYFNVINSARPISAIQSGPGYLATLRWNEQGHTGGYWWDWNMQPTSGDFQFYSYTANSVLTLFQAGRVGVNTATDNGADALQVNGTTYISGITKFGSTGWVAPVAGTGIAYGNTNDGLVLGGSGSTLDFALFNKLANLAIAVPTGAQRVLIATATDNGSDALQVNGSFVAGGLAAGQTVFALTRHGGSSVKALTAQLDSVDNIIFGTTNGDLVFKTKWNTSTQASDETLRLNNSGRVLVSGATDNGSDALQVNGSIYGTGLSTTGQIASNSSFYARGSANPYVRLNDQTRDFYLQLSGGMIDLTGGTVMTLRPTNGRVIVNSSTDNGVDALQVNGTIYAKNKIYTQGAQTNALDLYVLNSNGHDAFSVSTRTSGETITLMRNNAGTATVQLSTASSEGVNYLGARTILGNGTDNGVDQLQVNGSATFGNNAIKAAQFTFMNGYALTQINAGTMGVVGCDFAPASDNSANLGLAGNRWSTLHAVTGQFDGNVNAAAGTSGNQVVNFSQFAISKASSGYQKLPSGLIIQWGNSGPLNSGVTVTFPVAFPTACASVTLGFHTQTTTASASVENLTATSCYIYSATGNISSDCYWMAIGY